MKPRTKIQLKVVDMSKKLAQIGEKQVLWAKKNVLPHIAFRTNKSISCLDCGASWVRDTKRSTCICPMCKTKLEVKDTRKRVFFYENYFYVVETIENFQVNRLFHIIANYKKGQVANVRIIEVCQQWLREDGKYEFYSKLHLWGWASDRWIDWFEIRTKNESKYDIYTPYVYPIIKTLPLIKKYGVKRGIKWEVSPLKLSRGVLTDNRVESLLKMKQYDLLVYYLRGYKTEIEKHWRSICVCNRQKYIIRDASLWIDYLECLSALNYDTRSPKYICVPQKNLKQEHDKFMQKKRKEDERREFERKKEEIYQQEQTYSQDKGKFLDLVISKGSLEIKPLPTVKAFFEEGNKMHHCVFINEYYKRKDALILSARVGGERVETVEVSLASLSIIQSRGVCNKNTKYHKEIIDLVNRNMHLIEKLK